MKINLENQQTLLNIEDDEDHQCVDKGISNALQIHGYTAENNLIVKWDDAKHKDKGFIKYISDPCQKSSTGDPYSDIDKALGKIDGGVLKEARHPLVAAIPEIGVNMEKLILSKNQNFSKEIGETKTDEESHTVAISTSNTQTESLSIGLHNYGSFTASPNFSKEWSSSVTKEHSDSDATSESKGKSWSNTLGLNLAEAAFLNANVRYMNYGTAPIYEAVPTLIFVLGVGKNADSVASVEAKSNAKANIILPGNSYPVKEQNPIAFSANDDFNSQPIKLNYEQINRFEKGETLQIQTTQVSGLYKTHNMDDVPQIDEHQKWSLIFTEVRDRTACITINFDNEIIMRRRICARNVENYNNQTRPELTLKQAIELAFPDVVIDSEKNLIAYKDLYNGKPHIIVDDFFTHEQINKQLKEAKNDKIFNIKILKGMNILFTEKSDKKLLQEVSTFLKSFNEENRFALNYESNKNSQKTWQDILPEIQKALKDNFSENDYERIKNLRFYNSKPKLTAEANDLGHDYKILYFDIGNLGSGQVYVFFKGIFENDDKLIDSLKKFIGNLEYKDFSILTPKTWENDNQNFHKFIEQKISEQFGKAIFEKIKNIKYDLDANLTYYYYSFIKMTFEINNKNGEVITIVKMKNRTDKISKILLDSTKEYKNTKTLKDLTFEKILDDIKHNKDLAKILDNVKIHFPLNEIDKTAVYVYYNDNWHDTESRYTQTIQTTIHSNLHYIFILSIISHLLKFAGENSNLINRDETIEKIVNFTGELIELIKKDNIIQQDGQLVKEIKSWDKNQIINDVKNNQYYNHVLLDRIDNINYENLISKSVLNNTQNDMLSINNLTNLKWTDTIYHYDVNEKLIISDKDTAIDWLNMNFLVKYGYEYQYRIVVTVHKFFLEEPKNWDLNLFFDEIKNHILHFFSYEYDLQLTTKDNGKVVLEKTINQLNKTLPYNWKNRVAVSLTNNSYTTLSKKGNDSWDLTVKIDNQSVNEKISLKLKNIKD